MEVLKGGKEGKGKTLKEEMKPLSPLGIP